MNQRAPLAALLLAAALAAPVSASVCGLGGGAESYDRALDPLRGNIAASAALVQLHSFPDVRRFVDSTAGRICVSAIPLSKNIYQYYKFLVVISAQDGAALPLIFQAASVQAYENANAKPWLGLSRADFAREIAARVAETELKPIAFDAGSPVELLASFFPAGSLPIDPQSRGYALVPGVDPEWTTYLVSELRFSDTGNPFTSQYIQQVAVLQVDPSRGRARWGRLGGSFQAFSNLEQFQDESNPRTRDGDERLRRLIELSRP